MEVINVALNPSAIAEQYCKALWINNTCYMVPGSQGGPAL